MFCDLAPFSFGVHPVKLGFGKRSETRVLQPYIWRSIAFCFYAAKCDFAVASTCARNHHESILREGPVGIQRQLRHVGGSIYDSERRRLVGWKVDVRARSRAFVLLVALSVLANGCGGGSSSGSSDATAPVPVDPPTLELFTESASCSVLLDWSVQNLQPAAYSVFRSEAQQSNFELLSSGIRVRRFLDTAVLNGMTYVYLIAAMGSDGSELLQSNEAAGAPVSDSDRINARLNPSRTEGVAPLAVYFDALGTTAEDVEHPFHELDYEWDFGDPTSGTWATSGASKNTAFSAIAAHVFDRPGVYEVHLEVRDRSGHEATCQTTITVSDPDVVYEGEKTICFANDADDWSGVPEGAMRVVTDRWSAITGQFATGRRLLLRRGDRFVVDALGQLNHAGPGTIGAFGDGPLPIVSLEDEDIDALNPSGGETFDWRIMDLEFEGNANYGADAIDGTGRSLSHLLLYRLKFSNLSKAFQTSEAAVGHEGSNELFFIECEGNFIGMGSAPPPAPARAGAFFTAGRRHAMLGCEWTHAVVGFPTAGNGEFLARWASIRGLICGHSRFRGATEGNSILRVHATDWSGAQGIPPGTYTQHVILSDNEIYESSNAVPLKVGTASRLFKDRRIRDVIFERNYLHDNTNTNRKVFFNIEKRLTIRNNVVDMSVGGEQLAFEVNRNNHEELPEVDGPELIWFYNNTGYSTLPDSDEAVMLFVGVPCDEVFVRNNLLVIPDPDGPPAMVKNRSDGSVVIEGNLTVGSDGPSVEELFVSPDPKQVDDFRPREDSAVIDGGVRVPVYRDFGQADRPVGGRFDLGAFEFSN